MPTREHYTSGPATLVVGGCAEPPAVPPVIRGRPHLVGGDSLLAPASVAPVREGFPLLARPACETPGGDVVEWARASRRLLDERLANAGAVLLRGLPIDSVDAFSRFLVGLGYETMPYGLGVASRRRVAHNVMTANAVAPEKTIMLHNEMSYEPVVPRHLFLFCASAPGPGEGGETPIARGVDWHTELGNEFIAELERRGLRRRLSFPCATASLRAHDRPWQEHFGTQDRAQVERACAERGFEWTWERDGSLTIWSDVPVTSTRSGRRIWFCTPQMAHPLARVQIRHGDGSCLAPELVERLRDVQWKIAVAFAWRTGDVLCVDNLLCQHGRLSYAPSADRRVYVSMATPT
jgi:alpha-ketoglutarate-dependent taurine dioxygenase